MPGVKGSTKPNSARASVQLSNVAVEIAMADAVAGLSL